MKIERINDNAIRCTLTTADLESRHIKLSELAYGTEKARALFQEMMRQAKQDVGFEANDMPLVVEAIPISPEAIVLNITKVENPDELDTAFSHFNHGNDDEKTLSQLLSGMANGESADDLFQVLRRLKDSLGKVKREAGASMKAQPDSDSQNPTNAPQSPDSGNDSCPQNGPGGSDDPRAAYMTGAQIPDLINGFEQDIPQDLSPDEYNSFYSRFFFFEDLEVLMEACALIRDSFVGDSRLYKDGDNEQSEYVLVLTKGRKMTTASFVQVLNSLSEFASSHRYLEKQEAFLKEHSRVVLAKRAIETLTL
ncbi:MAG: adaptor protein MecA [Lachnospiraceae bacterium]|nr:adaptor protein MecA [Lachnospiraceae bacterium]MDY5742214.1 adaptor protein MecA [Lachnospiraceae bacterium]